MLRPKTTPCGSAPSRSAIASRASITTSSARRSAAVTWPRLASADASVPGHRVGDRGGHLRTTRTVEMGRVPRAARGTACGRTRRAGSWVASRRERVSPRPYEAARPSLQAPAAGLARASRGAARGPAAPAAGVGCTRNRGWPDRRGAGGVGPRPEDLRPCPAPVGRLDRDCMTAAEQEPPTPPQPTGRARRRVPSRSSSVKTTAPPPPPLRSTGPPRPRRSRTPVCGC